MFGVRVMKRRILIIDDEPGFTTLLKHSLESEGYYLVEEENEASHALIAAREFDPDLFILDVMMPEMDGSDVAAMLRADRRFKYTPILFLTALALNAEPPVVSSPCGGQIYLPKDTPIDKLMACIEEKIGRYAVIPLR